jgi:hypothetical protein
MGRHSAPEGRHRRNGALLAQAALVAVLALVTVSVLIGSGMVRDRMVDGTFASSETAEQATSRVETPEPTGEPSQADSGPPSMTGAPAPTPRAPDRMNSPENRGASALPAPMSRESTSGSPDTTPTSKPTTTAPTTTPKAPTTAHSITEPVQTFANCTEAKAAGASMIPSTDPRYARKLDRDRDGFACDAHGDPPTPSTTTTAPTTAPNTTPRATPTPSASKSTSTSTVKPASDVLGS